MAKPKPNLAVVPSAEPEKPTATGYPVTIELPTGGRFNTDTLLRELARHAFAGSLRGWRFEITDGRPRAFVTCQPLSSFTHEDITLATKRVQAALVALGIVKTAKPAEPPTPAPDLESTEADTCQPSPSES